MSVSGNFEDFGIGVNPGSVVFSAMKVVTSVVHVPIRGIFHTKTASDDLEECLAALTAGAQPEQPSQ